MKASSNVEELKKQLSDLKDIYKSIDLSNKFLSSDIDSVADFYCKQGGRLGKPIEPEKKYENRPILAEEKNEYILKKKKSVILFIVCLILIFLTGNINDRSAIGTIIKIVVELAVFAGAIFFFVQIKINREMANDREFEIQLNQERYEQDKIIYNENKNYNNTEYPKLIEQYKVKLDDYNNWRRKFDDKYYNELLPETKAKLEESKNKLSEYEGLISDDYICYLDKLIIILDKGRAESLKEAINILESDLHNERMLEEAREQNRILEQQRQAEEMRAIQREMEERRHRDRMLEAANRQAEAAERQARESQERAEQARRESERNEKEFNKAQQKYNDAIFRKQYANNQSTRDNYDREAAKAYSDMLKYK